MTPDDIRERITQLVSMDQMPDGTWVVTLRRPGGPTIMTDVCADIDHARQAVAWVIDQLTDAMLDTDG